MDILDRNVAITDVETSGLLPDKYEIIEIGLVVVDQHTLDVVDTLDVKVKLEHPEIFSEEAQKINGYHKFFWSDAIPLVNAMKLYREKTRDAIFCAHNVTFHWAFIYEAFKKTGVGNLMDYHKLDLLTMAWTRFQPLGLTKFNMNHVANYLGIAEEPMPHRAINGAMTEYKIFKMVMGKF